MELKEQAQRLFETYSFLALKTCRYGMKDLSEDEQKALDMAIDLHREELHRKLDETK